MNKKIITALFSALLLTSFYKANSMLFTTVNVIAPLVTKAITTGSKSMSKYLLKQHQLAGCRDNFEFIERLEKFGYTDDLKDFINNFIGLSPLNIAIQKDDQELIKKILSYCTKETINYGDNFNDETALYLACEEMNLELAKKLLPICTIKTINKASNRGSTIGLETPLYSSCNKLDVKMVKLLLEYGANIDKKSLDLIAGKNIMFASPRMATTRINFTKRRLSYRKTYQPLNLTREEEKQNQAEILRLLNLAQDCDNSESKIKFIDNQSNKETVEFLCKRLYSKYNLKYCGIKKALTLSENTKGLEKYSDCKIKITN